MTDICLAVAIAEVAIAALLLVRLAAGPTVSDRIVALNTMSTQAALAVVFFAAFAGRTVYLDVALWLASFSYLGGHRLVAVPGAGAAVREIIVIVLAVIGLAFSLSAVVGILRMPDVYSRIQCSSKTITMGALPALIALVVAEGPVSAYGSRALVIAALILVVNPAASHALARAAYKVGVPMWRGAVTDEVAEQAAGGGATGQQEEPGAGAGR